MNTAHTTAMLVALASLTLPVQAATYRNAASVSPIRASMR